MTVFCNDPIRVKITQKDLWNLTHKKGIDSCAYPSDQPDNFFIKLVACDINPFHPEQERHKEDIEKEIEKLKVVQDVVREFEPNRRFNSKKNMVVESVLDEKVFGKDNRYDVLLDKAKDVHRLKNGKLFGIIQNE